MAVGDIVTIGALQGTDKYGNSKKLQQVPSQSAPNFQDYALYTFVGNTDSKYGFKWIESKIDGKTVYISQTFVLKDVSYNEVIERANINKTLNINGSLYNLRLLSKDEFQNKLSSTVLDQLDFSITSSNPLYTLTSTILNGTNVINIIYNKDNYIPYIKSLWGENDFDLYTSSTANGCILALELLNNPPTISGEDENLGNKTSSFSITYSISDEDSDQELTVKEKLNGGPVKLVANLPYYITTPIVMKFLEEDIPVTDIVVMVQKEVADRMNAKPNTKDYGALSVAVQYYCDTEIVAKAPRHMFMPQPNVDSTVIGLHVREEQIYHVDNEDIFFKTVKASFGQRRKTLLNSLGGLGFLSKDQIKEALKEANIDEKRRGETLSIEEFASLSNAVNRIHNENK